MPLPTVQIWIKIFLKSSLVRINTVCNARLYALHRGGNFQVKSPQIVPVFSPLLPRLYLLGNQRPRTTTALLGWREGKIKVLKPHSPRNFPCHRVAGVANDWRITNKKNLKENAQGHKRLGYEGEQQTELLLMADYINSPPMFHEHFHLKIKYFMHLWEYTSYTCVYLQTCYNALPYVCFGHDGCTKLFLTFFLFCTDDAMYSRRNNAF